MAGASMLIQRILDLLGGRYKRRAAVVQHAFVVLTFRRLRLRLVHTPTADEIERIVRMIDPIYRRTKSLRAVQLLLGHSKLESTVRYLNSADLGMR